MPPSDNESAQVYAVLAGAQVLFSWFYKASFIIVAQFIFPGYLIVPFKAHNQHFRNNPSTAGTNLTMVRWMRIIIAVFVKKKKKC